MSISFSPTPAALRIDIKPSNYFGALLLGVALAACVAIFYAALAWPLRLLLGLVVLAYAAYCWRQQRRQRGILQWRSAWFWGEIGGAERALRLTHCTVWPGLIALVFRDIERRQNFVLTLLADSFASDKPRDDARRLRVLLNHFPVFAAAESGD